VGAPAVIETERLLLRTPVVADAEDLLAYIEDPEVVRWIGADPGDRSTAVASVERWLAAWQANGIGHFVIVRDGRVLGRAGFMVWDRSTWQPSTFAAAGEDAELELGWTLAREHWGRGYATEAAAAARAWADRGRVISLINPENVRSQRVAEKLGARPEERVETPGGPADVWVHPR
jgi:RimJ/RimL family protein N-acetyltransferase